VIVNNVWKVLSDDCSCHITHDFCMLNDVISLQRELVSALIMSKEECPKALPKLFRDLGNSTWRPGCSPTARHQSH